jgi:ADP-heptose:LPS heptosyltransferase
MSALPPAPLVVRLGSLGDLVLAGAVTAALGPVDLCTRPAWAEVGARLRGVRRVLTPDGLRGLAPPPTEVIDLQANLRSWALTRGVGAPVRRAGRASVRRQLRVAFKLPPDGSVVGRYARAAGAPPAPLPWLHLPRGAHPVAPTALVLIPGAAHPTKRWPVAAWRALAAAHPGPVVALGGPGEEELCAQIVDGRPEGRAAAGPGFGPAWAALGQAAAAVGGDTGLTHLALAAGVPTVTLFGPTCADDGFWAHAAAGPTPWAPVGRPLPCRPCSRHGGAWCAAGDHACLSALPVDEVLAALDGVLRCAAG